MATMQEQMQSAKAYIKAKQWDDARRVLKKIDHPTAKEWLKKVNELSPPKPTVGPFLEEDLWIGAVLLVASGILAAFTTSGFYNLRGVYYDDYYQATWLFLTIVYFVSMMVARKHWKL